MSQSTLSPVRRSARTGILIAALTVLLPLGGCGGGGGGLPEQTSPPGGDTTVPSITAPTIGTQPLAQSVTAPAVATFAVAAGGTAPLTYQWRSSTNGTDWSDISGATGPSYTTGATDTSMSGRYYSVLVSNAAGSVASSGVQLSVQAAPSGTQGGEFPHEPKPLAVAVTRADAALTSFDTTSARNATPAVAGDIAVADGISVTVRVPGDVFLEAQTLAITPVTVAAIDAEHPLPFKSVIATFDITPAADLDLEANGLVLVQFALSQQARDTLAAQGGQLVVFSARPDGTQLHLVPVYGGSFQLLNTHVSHLGVFGLGVISDEQAATLAAAWPSYDDLQLEAALAPASYKLLEARMAMPPADPGTEFARARPLGRVIAADAQSDAAKWMAEMQARLDAYYQDVLKPALAAANAADADLAQFQDATRKLLQWERSRQLLGLQDEHDVGVMEQVTSMARRGLDKARADCEANHNAAAASQTLGMLRQLALLGIEDTGVTVYWVMQTCGSSFEATIEWSQVHTWDADLLFPLTANTADTGRVQGRITTAGKLKMAYAASRPEVTVQSFDYMASRTVSCANGGQSCLGGPWSDSTTSAAPVVFNSGFGGTFQVSRWNLDARGHDANPVFSSYFTNLPGYAGMSFRVDAKYSDLVDTTPWSGSVPFGSSSRIVRRSGTYQHQYAVPGDTEHWSTSLKFNVIEVKPGT